MYNAYLCEVWGPFCSTVLSCPMCHTNSLLPFACQTGNVYGMLSHAGIRERCVCAQLPFATYAAPTTAV
jgi:hypothetical protein